MGQSGLREDQFIALDDDSKEKVIKQASYSKERYEICQRCERFTSLKTCNLCHCFIPMKVFFKRTSCPEDKWGKIED